ncbi:putative tRNA N6-adenosine threonylcarbamoyltransferase [Camellia lanceoleosa]|nr:putative tRNA N6-adenosine threonylcarbamoyltransferase [Camellia lanceoleosa]
MKKMIALVFEGSTNKIGVGVVTLDGSILSNPRHTHLCYPTRAGIPSQKAVVRILSRLWKKPIVAINHCVAHIEMGRVVLWNFGQMTCCAICRNLVVVRPL